jgi:glycine betaine/proline transport system substrate-binding protein
MKRFAIKQVTMVSAMAAAGLLLAACGGGVNEASTTTDAATDEGTTEVTEEAVVSSDCGTWGVAVHNWVGHVASSAVLSEVARDYLGCTINETTLAEAGVTYDAMEAGSVDVNIEDWGGGRWQEWVDRGAIQELGGNGNIGLIGMYVPQWMADEYPDITDAANLNKYSDLFRTPESGDKGAWYEGPPGYTTIGEKMITANNLNYTVINTGSEAALIELFTQAAENKTPALGYFYEPQNFLAQVELARVNFPASDWTDAAEASGLTDYPETVLVKLGTTKLMESGSDFATLLQNFTWTNADQNEVAANIENGMSPSEAAQKWIAENQDTVQKWLAGTSAG